MEANRNESEFLASYNLKDYEKPSIATDMAVFTISKEKSQDYRKLSKKELSILLIKRGEHPFKGYWALPGGFVRKGETFENAAYRELEEETGVNEVYLSQLHNFSKPDRDPRGWIVSCAYMALGEEEKFQIQAGSDASDAKWFHIRYGLVSSESENIINNRITKKRYQLVLTHDDINLSALIEAKTYLSTTEYEIINSDKIAFDHAEIIAYAINYLRNNSMLAFEFMPENFTLTDLQHVYETILEKKLLTANFRRKISDFVIQTDEKIEGFGHRPSKLFRKNIVNINEEASSLS